MAGGDGAATTVSLYFLSTTLTFCHVFVVISRAISVQNNLEVKEKRKAAVSAFEYKVRKHVDALKLHCDILSSSTSASFLINYIQQGVYMLFSVSFLPMLLLIGHKSQITL